MSFKYNSKTHVTNIVKKNNRKIGLQLSTDEYVMLTEIISDFWDVSNDSYIKEVVIDIDEDPLSKLSRESMNKNHNSSACYISRLKEILEVYKKIKNNRDIKELEIKHMLRNFKSTNIYNIKIERLEKGRTHEEFEIDLNNVKNEQGIYFLYDKSKVLIYVGKSNTLGKRIPTSIEGKSAYYYEYAITRSLSDVAVYESYYIALLKPNLNRDCNFPDILTIKLPCIRDFVVRNIYEESIESEWCLS